MTAFELALLSGIAHAAWNALAKTPGAERAATLSVLILSAVVASVRWALSDAPMLTLGQAPWVALAGAGEASYVFALGMAYARGDLALTYTVSRATALVCIWPLSLLAFGTGPSALALLATGLVIGGILFSRRSAAGTSRWHVGWTLLTGASVAAYHTGYKGAVDAGATRVLAFLGALSLAIPALLVLVGADVRRQIPALLVRPRLLVAGVLCAASFLLMLEALTTASSGPVLGVRNGSVAFGLLFAILQGERLSGRQWVGVLVLFGGVALFGLAAA